MRTPSLARRYAPLLGLLAVQLVVIAAFPSKAERPVATATAAPVAPGVAQQAGDGEPAIAGPGSTPTTAAATDATAPGGKPVGDTSHCVAGRQFDPAIDYYAPPCVPAWSGSNGGSTYRGVTATTVKLIQYYPRQNPAVSAIATALGANVTTAQLQQLAAVVEPFINDHYELYGRRVVLKVVQGDCVNVPPDPACFRNEFRRIVQAEQPYAVIWNGPLCSACFDELSALQVVNIGGYHFQDSFSRARAPYHWDVQESGTTANQAFGELWCADLTGKPAVHAVNRPGNTNGAIRKLGVISANDPQNQGAVGALKAALGRCGQRLAAEYYYSQDISSAPQQAQTALRRLKEAGVTTLLCECDAVSATLLYGGEEQNGYYPENVIAGLGFADADTAGQGFDGRASCTTGPPCAFDGAFGLSSLAAQEPIGKDRVARVWHAGGGKGDPPFATALQVWDYWSLAATLVQAAGPNLTPATMDAGVRAYGMRGGGASGQIARGFPAGSYSWAQDMRVVYWDRSGRSAYNGKPGTFVQLGPRATLGGYRPGATAGVPRRT